MKQYGTPARSTPDEPAELETNPAIGTKHRTGHDTAINGTSPHTDGHPFPISPIPSVNVSSVPQRSPLRYPGGKTWLIPHIRYWLRQLPGNTFTTLHEPFAGGATASLTAVMEHSVDRAVIGEIDADIIALWNTVLRESTTIRRMITEFTLTEESVNQIEEESPDTDIQRAFRTLILNRTRRGGILADGASTNRHGENGRGISSRWYPATLNQRIQSVARFSQRLTTNLGDGIDYIASLETRTLRREILFIDPPYTASGKQAGTRLYTHSVVDHHRLFETLADCRYPFLMTYDTSPEIIHLINKFGYNAVQVLMKNTHHQFQKELVITREPLFQ